MNNTFKRIISVLLAVCIIMSLGIIGAMAETNNTLKLTVGGFKDGQQVSVICMTPDWDGTDWHEDEANIIYLDQVAAANGSVSVNVNVENPVEGEYYIIVNGVIYRQALIQKPAADGKVTTDKGIYLVNENITVTVITGKDAANVGIFNENGKGITKLSSSYVDYGTERYWTIVVKMETKGDRKIMAKAVAEGQSYADVDYLGSADVSVVKSIVPTKPVEPEIIAGTLTAPEKAVAKQPFAITVKTTKAVANIGIFNESGAGITAVKSYVDTDDAREWTITPTVSSSGARNFALKIAGNDGKWIDTDCSFDIRITKK